MGPVVGSVLTAVGVVPGVVSHNGVPESVSCCTVSEDCSYEACSEVGFEEALAEVNVDEVLSLIVVLEVEAFQVAVVPGVVSVGDSGGDQLLLGSVPVFVVSDEGG